MTPPKIEDAPGIAWKPRKDGRWLCRWQCRTDIRQRGFEPSSLRLWCGKIENLTEQDVMFIQHKARSLQDDMLVWSRGGLPEFGAFDGTMLSLIRSYHTDADSPYHSKRFASRRYYDALCKTIERGQWTDKDGITYSMADTYIADINSRMLLRWHEAFSGNGKMIPKGHACIGMVRTLMTFGSTILDSEDCQRVKGLLHSMRFKTAAPRVERLTSTQVDQIRAMARTMGYHSIALAQAIQFEGTLRQKDIIGEWVPMSEPDFSAHLYGNEKWLRGIRWDEIDADLTLTHVTSKRQKELVVSLRNAPMVIEEFCLMTGATPETLTRAMLPKDGPVILDHRKGQPWTADEFRRLWRKVANACGIPKSVRNMDSRAGAITEATDAGADLESVRHAATHSDIAMTQKYSRGSAEKIAKVQELRIAHRNKSGT